ncbi:hypothetical protein EOD39_11046 [Acipenser ruthenus]|uniref:Uncharacterized protein n=1 Tax=Acipenser ruthenus TaxID=7906 RepID=A0A662YSJ3_ACIRT|nr:hypothetical protein EOD39_11046 [Acipenser ruthenus]
MVELIGDMSGGRDGRGLIGDMSGERDGRGLIRDMLGGRDVSKAKQFSSPCDAVEMPELRRATTAPRGPGSGRRECEGGLTLLDLVQGEGIVRGD